VLVGLSAIATSQTRKVAKMAESNLLVEKRNELAAKSKKFADVSALIQSPDDYGKKEVQDALGAVDMKDAETKLGEAAKDLDNLGRDVGTLNIEEMKRANSSRLEGLKQPIRQAIPGSSMLNEPRSFGELVTSAKSWAGSRTPVGTKVEVDLGEHGLKTLLQTSAGLQPRTGNGNVLVDKIIRPVQVIDLIPRRPDRSVRDPVDGRDDPHSGCGGTRRSRHLPGRCVRVHASHLASPENRFRDSRHRRTARRRSRE
jgi:hypothetical protein